MPLSLRQAAVQARTSKTTLLRGIKSGKLSATRTENGGWSIDPSELLRAFPPDRAGPAPAMQGVPAADQADQLVAELRAQLARMDRTLEDTREDRDRWRAAFERQQALLPPPLPAEAPAEPTTPLARAWRWMRKAG